MTDPIKELRVDIKVTNNRLRERREKLGLTQAQMAQTIGVPIADYATLETMKSSPVRTRPLCAEDRCNFRPCGRTGYCKSHFEKDRPKGTIRRSAPEWRKVALDLADFYCCQPDELFPDIVKNGPLSVSTKVDAAEAGALIERLTNVFLPDDNLEHRELSEHVERALRTLTPREEKVIKKRFGIGCDTDETLADVARDFEISEGRVQQIEAKALRKLRHPSRSKTLKPWSEP